MRKNWIAKTIAEQFSSSNLIYFGRKFYTNKHRGSPVHTRIHSLAFLSTALSGFSENSPHRHWSSSPLLVAADKWHQKSLQGWWTHWYRYWLMGDIWFNIAENTRECRYRNTLVVTWSINYSRKVIEEGWRTISSNIRVPAQSAKKLAQDRQPLHGLRCGALEDRRWEKWYFSLHALKLSACWIMLAKLKTLVLWQEGTVQVGFFLFPSSI